MELRIVSTRYLSWNCYMIMAIVVIIRWILLLFHVFDESRNDVLFEKYIVQNLLAISIMACFSYFTRADIMTRRTMHASKVTHINILLPLMISYFYNFFYIRILYKYTGWFTKHVPCSLVSQCFQYLCSCN